MDPRVENIVWPCLDPLFLWPGLGVSEVGKVEVFLHKRVTEIVQKVFNFGHIFCYLKLILLLQYYLNHLN